MAELERKAGYGLVISLSLTSMIGTGMFFGPKIAASWSGNASIFAWVILSIITVYVGACFAELSSLFPGAGGVYAFAKKAYGRFLSFLVGWITWLVNTITPALVIVAALDFLMPMFNPLTKIAIAIALLIILNVIALRGIEASQAVLIFFAVITVAVIISILGAGFFHIEPGNYVPLFHKPVYWILISLFFIMETFFGWESATFMGDETKNPAVVIPKSIMISTIIVAVIGILFPLVVLGVVPWATLINLPTPLTTVAFVVFGGGAVGQAVSSITNIAIFLALVGSAAGGIVSSPRLILSLAKDKLFIAQLSAIHPKFKTPYKAIYFQIVVAILVILASFGEYEALLSLLVPLAIVMYIFVLISVPILRRKHPDIPRYIKVPFVTFGTSFIALFFLGVIAMWLYLDPVNALPLFTKMLSFILFGIPIYFLLNLYYNPDMLLTTVNTFAVMNKYFEGFTLPKRVRMEILTLFGGLGGKTVLEFGSGVGTLTEPLADIVGPSGHIYATDLSLKNIDILHKRMKKRGHKHYSAIHDKHLISRVHPDIPAVDAIFSVGNLSYVQDLKTVLRGMRDLLPENGRICFVEYVDYFWGIIPNQAWLDDSEQIQSLFREQGFSVRVRKRRGFLWKYLYIYGIKSDHDVPII